jgi:transcriptional regulator with XRE-family HTH domain
MLSLSIHSLANPEVILHRIREVRLQQGMSVRTAARHLGVEARFVRELESPNADLRLSDLYRWQEALDVPVAELLVEPHEPLSRPVLERARLVKLMKTAQAMLEKAPNPAMKRMAQMMIEQLCEIMPELAGVGPWPSVGKRRSTDDMGKIAEQQLRMDMPMRDGD